MPQTLGSSDAPPAGGSENTYQTRCGDAYLYFIQLIPSNNQLHPCVTLTENLNPVSNFRVSSGVQSTPKGISSYDECYLPLLRQGGDINAYRDGSNFNEAPLSLNASWKCLQGQYPTNSLSELRDVSAARRYNFGVKSDLKCLAKFGVWNPIKSEARRPFKSCSRTERQRKISEDGNATWRKNPIGALGSFLRIIAGKSIK